MRKVLSVISLAFCLAAFPIQQTKAQIPIVQIIKAAIKKVIKAVDLQVQRIQNKTIGLQNAQKALENKMSKMKLDEIRDWVDKHRKMYDDYFKELWKVKTMLTHYQRVKDIIQHQVQLVSEYKAAWALFRQDKNFTPGELDYIFKTYSGILNETAKGIDQLFIVVKAFATQMNDAKRLEIINTVSDNVQQQLVDMRQFNNQNKAITLQRAFEKGEIEYIRRLYGLAP